MRGEVDTMEYEKVYENVEEEMETLDPILTNSDLKIQERNEIKEDFRIKMENCILVILMLGV